MAVAVDVVSTPGATFTGTTSWTHTPVGTPRAVLVGVFNVTASAVDEVGSISYGGVPLTEAAGLYKATGEPGGVSVWFAGAGLPAGPQTVTVTTTGGTIVKAGSCRTFTALADVEKVDDQTWSSDALSNPSGTLTLGGREALCLEYVLSGHSAVANFTPLPNWTGTTNDLGVNVIAEWVYGIVGTADVAVGWTQVTEDATGYAVALAEIVIGGITAGVGAATGAGSAVGTGAGRAAVTATATGLATAAAVAVAFLSGVATATASATASADGRAVVGAVGQSSAAAMVVGIATGGGAVLPGVGRADAASSALAAGGATRAASATASGAGMVAGVGGAMAGSVGMASGGALVLGRAPFVGAPGPSRIDAAVIERLAGDAVLRGLVPDGVWFSVAPPGATRFVVLQRPAGAIINQMFAEAAWEVYLYLVEVVVAETNPAQADLAAARIWALLHNQRIPIAGYELLRLQAIDMLPHFTEVDASSEVRWQHRGAQYEIQVQAIS